MDSLPLCTDPGQGEAMVEGDERTWAVRLFQPFSLYWRGTVGVGVNAREDDDIAQLD